MSSVNVSNLDQTKVLSFGKAVVMFLHFPPPPALTSAAVVDSVGI